MKAHRSENGIIGQSRLRIPLYLWYLISVNSKVEYWLEIAEYDLETADAMLKTKRFLYVGFMCHQAVEKTLKAVWQNRSADFPPKTHNLIFIIEKLGIKNRISDHQYQLLSELDPLNIESRYPTYKELLLKKLDDAYCELLIKRTREFLEWIRQHYIK